MDASKRIGLVMPAAELAELDAYCADLRRATGAPAERSAVIRQAIRLLVRSQIQPHDPRNIVASDRKSA